MNFLTPFDIILSGSYKEVVKIKTKNCIKISITVITFFIILCLSACSGRNKIPTESIKIGDTFSYGSYEQDNNKSNGAEKIDWLVLAREDNRILLISKYALDCQPFNDDYTGTSWKDSYLRSWLNTEFIENAFNGIERNSIITTEIKAKEITDDKIFVLDNAEAEKYFRNDTARRCTPTEYAKKRGVMCPDNLQDVEFDEDVKNNCCYWLLSPGFHNDKVSIVDYYGTIDNRGEFVDERTGVRPALWLNIDAL